MSHLKYEKEGWLSEKPINCLQKLLEKRKVELMDFYLATSEDIYLRI